MTLSNSFNDQINDKKISNHFQNTFTNIKVTNVTTGIRFYNKVFKLRNIKLKTSSCYTSFIMIS